MFKQYLCLACALIVSFCLVESASLISLNRCKSEDSKCIKETTKLLLPIFAKGLPEYGVESLDPLRIKSINASEANLLYVLTDVTIVGMKNCEAKKVSRDKSKSKVYVKLQCSSTLEGDYILEGSVLLIPLHGKGKLHVGLNSAIFDLDIDIVEKTGDDGKIYWNAKSFKLNFELKDKSTVVFENLNKGNELLEHASTALLESNGNDVIKEIGFTIIQTVINKIVKNVNHFFKAIPAEDLSLD